MSASGFSRREVAHRLFAVEYDDASLEYSESDEERAPKYVVTPTGARVNRLSVVGVLTAVERVNDDMIRARVVDPTGAFIVYAGQYQPEALATFESLDPPAFVAVTGKARTFIPDDGDRVYTSIRPESVNEVDAATRDRWTVQAVSRTLDRIAAVASALEFDATGTELEARLLDDGMEPGLAKGVALAIDHYDVSPAYLAALRDVALDAARVVAGTEDEVRRLTVAPGETTTEPVDHAALLIAPGRTHEREAATPASDAAVAPESTDAAATDAADASATDDSDTVATDAADASATDDSDTVATDAADASATDDSDSSVGTPEPTPDATEVSADDETTTPEPETETPADEATAPDEELGDLEEWSMDDEERERLEDEYGASFSSGNEIGAPGDADIETADSAEPDVGDTDASVGTEDDESVGGDADVDASTDTDADTDESTNTDADADLDLHAVVVETMRELDDGSGAAREELLATVVDAHGVAADDVEDAIQAALLSGECYEVGDDALMPI